MFACKMSRSSVSRRVKEGYERNPWSEEGGEREDRDHRRLARIVANFQVFLCCRLFFFSLPRSRRGLLAGLDPGVENPCVENRVVSRRVRCRFCRSCGNKTEAPRCDEECKRNLVGKVVRGRACTAQTECQVRSKGPLWDEPRERTRACCWQRSARGRRRNKEARSLGGRNRIMDGCWFPSSNTRDSRQWVDRGSQHHGELLPTEGGGDVQFRQVQERAERVGSTLCNGARTLAKGVLQKKGTSGGEGVREKKGGKEWSN
jgi:hypothetical protein